MKKNLLLSTLFCLLTAVGHTQTLTGGCFDEYNTVFRNRGAKFVLDGDQKIVVATKRNGDCSCFMGKVMVKNGEVVLPLYIEKEDGSFQEFKTELLPAFQLAPPERANRIEEGMTITFRTSDDEFVKAFFINFLSDKPKINKQAPSARTFLK